MQFTEFQIFKTFYTPIYSDDIVYR